MGDKKRGSTAVFCRKTGISPSTVNNWRKRGSGVLTGHVALICKAYGVNEKWLLSGEGLKWDVPGATEVPKLRRMVPLLNVVQAGRLGGSGMIPEDTYEPGDAPEWVPAYREIRVGKYAFALTVEGDSMMPRIEPGDVVIVEPEYEAQTGDIVVAKCLRTGEVRIKTYRKTSDDLIILQSANQNYEPIVCKPGDDSEIKILGVVIEIRRYPRRR